MPKRRLIELREARVNRLIEESKNMKEQAKEQEREQARNMILQK